MNLLNFGGKSPVLRYGVLVIAFILWYFLIYDPFSSKRESLKNESHASSLKIKKLKKDIDENRNLDKAFKEAKEQFSILNSQFLTGDDPNVAASGLQNILLKDAEEAGLDVSSYKISPSKKWKEHHVVGVDMRVKAQTEGLVHFLRLLEKEKGIFRIFSLNITKVQGKNQHLSINMEVEGLYSKGASQ
jgi:hypothetical protein